MLAVYVGTGAGHFDPASQASVFNAQRGWEAPLGAEDRRSFQSELHHLILGRSFADAASETNKARVEKWGRLLRDAAPSFDADGHPVLMIPVGDKLVSVGVSGSNILTNDAPQPLTEKLLEARLNGELRRGNPPKVSESDVENDWNLLQKARGASEVAIGTRRMAPSAVQAQHGGNQPLTGLRCDLTAESATPPRITPRSVEPKSAEPKSTQPNTRNPSRPT